MNVMNLKNRIYIFWGVMDVISILSYVGFSILRGNIPFYTDTHHFLMNFMSMNVGGWSGLFIIAMFVFNIIFYVSLFCSIYLFFSSRTIPVLFLVCQEFLRLCSFTCSVSIIHFVLYFIPSYPAYIGILLFTFSEFCKVGTLWWYRRCAG